MRKSIIIAAALALAGCASTPVSNNDAKIVPSSRALSKQFSTPNAGAEKVVIKRDAGLMGSACATRIYVDAVAVADLRPGEKVETYLPAGAHIISAEPNGACGGRLTEVSANVALGKPLAFRIWVP